MDEADYRALFGESYKVDQLKGHRWSKGYVQLKQLAFNRDVLTIIQEYLRRKESEVRASATREFSSLSLSPKRAIKRTYLFLFPENPPYRGAVEQEHGESNSQSRYTRKRYSHRR